MRLSPLLSALGRRLDLIAPLLVLILALAVRVDEPPLVGRLRDLAFDSYQRLMPRPIGEAPVRESLLMMRADLADLRERLDVADETASSLPHREKYLKLNHRLARRVVDAHEEWLDEVERELG